MSFVGGELLSDARQVGVARSHRKLHLHTRLQVAGCARVCMCVCVWACVCMSMCDTSAQVWPLLCVMNFVHIIMQICYELNQVVRGFQSAGMC